MTIIQLCRFNENNKLLLSSQDITTQEYVAISHVWGSESAITYYTIDGIPTPVPLSPQKAAFVTKQLPGIVLNEYFWMDVLAVDQMSDESRASVVKHIPQIYREAKYTLIVREQNGLQSCCNKIFESEQGSESETLEIFEADKWVQLSQHIKEEHPNGLQEIWLERNWPLQELFLSDTVKFALCEQASNQERLFGEGYTARVDVGTWQSVIIGEELKNMANRWAGVVDENGFDRIVEAYSQLGLLESQAATEAIEEMNGRQAVAKTFLKAVFANTEVTRLPFAQSDPALSDIVREYIHSTRRTGKPRDFILALFPQFSWYTLPESYKTLSFGHLFEDCMNQIHGFQEDHGEWECVDEFIIRPKLTRGIVDGFNVDKETSKQTAANVPEPVCLGDFFKLIHVEDNPVPAKEGRTVGAYYWMYRVDSNNLTPQKFVSLLSDTLWHMDPLALEKFLAQLAVWNTDKGQLLQLLSLQDTSHGLNSRVSTKDGGHRGPQSEAEQLLVGLGLQTMESLLILSNILAVQNMYRFGPMFSHIQANFRALNPHLSDFEAQNLREPAPIEAQLGWLESQMRSFDSANYDALLYLTASAACGFGLSAIPWLRENLQIYALKCFEENLIQETLVFAAKGLDTEILDNDFVIEAYLTGWEPYVLAVSGNGDSKEMRIVALAPKKGDCSPNVVKFGEDED